MQSEEQKQNETNKPEPIDFPECLGPERLFVALWSLPGCMPEAEPFRSLSWNAARDHLAEQVEAEAEAAAQGIDSPESLAMLKQCDEAEALLASADFESEFAFVLGAYVYEVRATTPDDEDEERRAALGALLDVDLCEIDECAYDSDTLEADGAEWLVLTDEEATELANEAIERDLWAFRPEFLENYMPDGVDASILQAIAEAKYEDASESFAAMLGEEGLESVKRDALASDGRGHFLAQYDFEERESGEYFVFRVN